MQQLQDRLPELLDRVVNSGEECVVQRDGKDCAVIVNARQWRRRTVGRRLDELGAAYRLSRPKQVRAEQLLATREQRSLTVPESRELRTLLRECDAILARRVAALDLPS